MKRSIEEDDLYEVLGSMQSDLNTQRFAKLWDEELLKPNPSILRVMYKLHGFYVIGIGFLYSIADTLARCVILCSFKEIAICSSLNVLFVFDFFHLV